MHIVAKAFCRAGAVLAIVLSMLFIASAISVDYGRTGGRPTSEQIMTLPVQQLMNEYYNDRNLRAYFDANTKKKCGLVRLLVVATQSAIKKQQAKLEQLRAATRSFDADGSTASLATSLSLGSSPEDIVRNALVNLEGKRGTQIGPITIDDDTIKLAGATLLQSLSSLSSNGQKEQAAAQTLATRLDTMIAQKQATKADSKETTKTIEQLAATALPDDQAIKIADDQASASIDRLDELDASSATLQTSLTGTDQAQQLEIQDKIDDSWKEAKTTIQQSLTVLAEQLPPAVMLHVPPAAPAMAAPSMPPPALTQAVTKAEEALAELIALAPTEELKLRLQAAQGTVLDARTTTPARTRAPIALPRLRKPANLRGRARRQRTTTGRTGARVGPRSRAGAVRRIAGRA